MEIKNINSTSFNGIYRIKNTPENIKRIEKEVIPVYRTLRKQPITMFIGMNPFQNAFIAMGLKAVAHTEKSSEEWVRMNAEANGISLNNSKDDVIHVVTGNEDCLNLLKYLKKYMEDHFYKMNFLKRFKLSYNISQNIIKAKAKDAPKHLLPLIWSMVENEQETETFKKTMVKGRTIETSDSINELLNSIMRGD